MSTEESNNSQKHDAQSPDGEQSASTDTQIADTQPTALPGVAAIALWLLFGSLIGVAGVWSGRFAGHSTR